GDLGKHAACALLRTARRHRTREGKMKANRPGARRPQLNRESQATVPHRGSGTAPALPEPEDSSQSGIRAAVSPETIERELAAQASTAVTVVFRGVLPMERLVQMIRRRAAESAPSTPLCVEVEQHADA